MSRVVLGGGLGGLSAAKYLVTAFPKDPVIIVEASNRTGGWIKSTHLDDGTIFEQGPRTIRPKGEAGENTLELIEKLKLQNEIRPISSTHPAATNRMIYAKGKLHALPSNFMSIFLKKSPFSKPLFMHLLTDVMSNKKKVETNDESIYDFTNRRFGKEVADYLISPIICGICAGNAKEISVKFLMERLFYYEQRHGSVTKGIIANYLRSSHKEKSPSRSYLCNKSRGEKWSVYSFKNGMESFPKALAKDLQDRSVKIELNTPIENLKLKANEDIEIKTKDKIIKTKHIVSSLSAQTLATLIEKDHPALADLLKKIPTVSVAVINLKYDSKHIKKDGFGFLTSPGENLPLLGVIYDSCCFPCGEKTILTAMMGGYWFEKYFGNNPSEDYLFKTAKDYIEQILGITDQPIDYKVNILHNCIPQYIVGHQDVVNDIENYIKTHKLPLSICGSSYYGVGVNDVVLSAKKAVTAINI